MHEFEFIASLLEPLAHPDYAHNLRNDAASLPGNLIITTDTLNEGVHFLPDSDPGLLARKALRVNLSDAAAMGAKPLGYTLNLSLPDTTDQAWLEAFTQGLGQDQQQYGLKLLGGDTTGGPLSISVTLIGETSNPLPRDAAQEGEGVYITGTIGEAALGLLSLRQQWGYDAAQARYHLPDPPVAFAVLAAPYITAALDVSDGLLQDAGHIAKASGVKICLRAGAIPFAQEVQHAMRQTQVSLEQMVTGGDDYQLLFTMHPSHEEVMMALAQKWGVRVSNIGDVKAGRNLELLNDSGVVINFDRQGWQHF